MALTNRSYSFRPLPLDITARAAARNSSRICHSSASNFVSVFSVCIRLPHRALQAPLLFPVDCLVFIESVNLALPSRFLATKHLAVNWPMVAHELAAHVIFGVEPCSDMARPLPHRPQLLRITVQPLRRRSAGSHPLGTHKVQSDSICQTRPLVAPHTNDRQATITPASNRNS